MLDCCYGGVSSSVTEMDGCSLTTGRSPFSLSLQPEAFRGDGGCVVVGEGGMFLPHDVKNKVVIHSVGEGRETDQGQEMIKAGHVCSSAVVVRISCQQVTRAGFSSVLTPKYSWINIQIIYC